METYHSLADLQAAFQDGRLDPVRDKLTLDNDHSYLCSDSEDSDDSEAYPYEGEGPEELLREALDLLGIPWEDV
jgi:hypothetical protein